MTAFVNRNDVWWHDAPIPRRWHRCRAWTVGEIDEWIVERCACGAIRRRGEDGWLERNSRRDDEREWREAQR